MGVDMTSGRNEGVSSANVQQYQGPNADGLSMAEAFKMVGAGNPGPTANLRGVSSNTALMGGISAPDCAPGSDQNIPAPSELTYSAPISASDSTGLTAITHSQGWSPKDSAAFVRPMAIEQDSFDTMHDHYPGNPMGVNDEPY